MLGMFYLIILTCILDLVLIYVLSRIQFERQVCEELKKEMLYMRTYGGARVHGQFRPGNIEQMKLRILVKEQLLQNRQQTYKLLYDSIKRVNIGNKKGPVSKDDRTNNNS